MRHSTKKTKDGGGQIGLYENIKKAYRNIC